MARRAGSSVDEVVELHSDGRVHASRSAASCPASRTWSGSTRGCTCRGGPRRARVCRPARWRSPASSPAVYPSAESGRLAPARLDRRGHVGRRSRGRRAAAAGHAACGSCRDDPTEHRRRRRGASAGSVRDAGRTGRAHLGREPRGSGGPRVARAGQPAGRQRRADAGAIESSGGLHAAGGGTPGRWWRSPVAVATIDVVDGPPVGWGAPIVLPAGAALRIGRLIEGTRVVHRRAWRAARLDVRPA